MILSRLWAALKASPATYILIALNVGVFVVTCLAGATQASLRLDPFALYNLYDWGALSSCAVIDGQYWRLLSYMFLHGNTLHILCNMIFLWRHGTWLEPRLGVSRLLLLYLISGTFAGLAKVYAGRAVAAGASSAAFGLFGCVLFHREIRRTHWSWYLWAPIELASLLPIPEAHLSHVSGFVTGLFLFGFLTLLTRFGRIPPLRQSLYLALIALTGITYAVRSWPSRTELWSEVYALWDSDELNRRFEASDRFLEYCPIDYDALLVRGQCHEEDAEYTSAVKLYSVAIYLYPGENDAYLSRGYVYTTMGKYELAVSDYSFVLSRDSENSYALAGRAYAYAWLDMPVSAVEDVTKSIETREDPIRGYLERGAYYFRQKEYEKTKADWETAANRATNSEDKGAASERIGLLYLLAEDWAGALTHALKVDQLHQPMALNSLVKAVAYDKLGDSEAAEASHKVWRANREGGDDRDLRALLDQSLWYYLRSPRFQ